MQRQRRTTRVKTRKTKQNTQANAINTQTSAVNIIASPISTKSFTKSVSSSQARGISTSTTRKSQSSINSRKTVTFSQRSYHPNVIDHYENPRNVGSFNAKDNDVGTGLVGAPACGDVMKLQVKVNNGVVEDVKFRTFGCGSAIASSSYATEWLKGKTVEEALTIKNTDIAHHLALPPVKMHCSMLAEDAVKAALQDYQKKQSGIKNGQTSSIDPTKVSPTIEAKACSVSSASMQSQMQQAGSPHTQSADV